MEIRDNYIHDWDFYLTPSQMFDTVLNTLVKCGSRITMELYNEHGITEAYLEPSQTSMMKLFCENS